MKRRASRKPPITATQGVIDQAPALARSSCHRTAVNVRPGAVVAIMVIRPGQDFLIGQGTFGNGSLALSSYVFNEQQSANASVADGGRWTEMFLGTNQSLSYSGGDGPSQ